MTNLLQALWAVRANDGRLVGVRTTGQDQVLALFTTPEIAEAWILGMASSSREMLELEQCVPTVPLFGERLVGLLHDAETIEGFKFATLDPPGQPGTPFSYGEIVNLRGQVELQLERSSTAQTQAGP